ncbi:MAG TPA: Stp1/IreP family PP2C-type Ser/Thr phosphatase [Actinomycetota bacterium]|nr:Stp1/IreP family PP2C-type Ser/Thr phosphatase [Actinomycetota bacterium]
MTLRLRVGARTDVGRVRQGNEDAFTVQHPLFAVADGMGGHQGGEVASKLALERLERVTDGQADLAQVVRDANRAVFSKAAEDPGLRGMGTTLTAVLVQGDRLHWAHVGDSRMYRARDGQLERITTDHTVVEQLVEQGRLTPKEAEIHPQRSILVRALGVEEDVEVDEGDVEVRSGDRLLLCSDGLTGMVDEDDILRILTDHQDAQAASDALVAAANEAGGQDNITALVLDVEGADAAAPARPVAPQTETVERPLAMSEPAVPVVQRSLSAGRGGDRRWLRRLAWVLLALVLIGGALFAVKRYWVDQQWYIGESNGVVALYRGIPAAPLGFELFEVVETTTLRAQDVTRFPEYRDLDEGITAQSEQDARDIVAQMLRDLNEARRQEAQGP